MPTIKGIRGPFRFHFYSFDCNEPMHVHAERENATCKFWLNPLVLANNHGFAARDLGRIRAIVQVHREQIKEAWDEHCSSH